MFLRRLTYRNRVKIRVIGEKIRLPVINFYFIQITLGVVKKFLPIRPGAVSDFRPKTFLVGIGFNFSQVPYIFRKIVSLFFLFSPDLPTASSEERRGGGG